MISFLGGASRSGNSGTHNNISAPGAHVGFADNIDDADRRTAHDSPEAEDLKRPDPILFSSFIDLFLIMLFVMLLSQNHMIIYYHLLR